MILPVYSWKAAMVDWERYLHPFISTICDDFLTNLAMTFLVYEKNYNVWIHQLYTGAYRNKYIKIAMIQYYFRIRVW